MIYAGLALGWLAAIIIEVVHRKRAGSVLLSLGRSLDGLRISFGVMLTLIGVLFIVVDFRGNVFRGVAHVLWGLYYLTLGTHQVEIRDAGIFRHRKLIQWKEFSGFSLLADGALRLQMREP